MLRRCLPLTSVEPLFHLVCIEQLAGCHSACAWPTGSCITNTQLWLGIKSIWFLGNQYILQTMIHFFMWLYSVYANHSINMFNFQKLLLFWGIKWKRQNNNDNNSLKIFGLTTFFEWPERKYLKWKYYPYIICYFR